MTLDDLIGRFRQRADDAASPPLNDDETVRGWLNEAVNEACIRARLIFDTSSAFLTIPIVVDQAVYTLDPSIIQIADMWLTNRRWILEGTDQSALDRGSIFPRWRGRYRHHDCYALWGRNWRTWKGSPRYFIQDGTRLQLVPIPTEVDTLNLSVYRLPVDSEVMDAPAEEPVIAAQWHDRLIDWALFRAYDSKDGEEIDDTRAGIALARFEASFGKRLDAAVERKRAERRSHTTVTNWP